MDDPPRYSCLAEVDDSYTPLLCYQQCLLEPMEGECNCSYIGVNHPADPNTNVTVCSPSEILTCGYKALQKQYQKDPHYASNCKVGDKSSHKNE